MADLHDIVLMRIEPLRHHLSIWRAAWALDRLRPRLISRTADELAFLPAAMEIVETPVSPGGRATVWAIISLFSVTLLWACLGQVDVHATAPGRIIPAGKTKRVASSEMASVAAIHVRDGDPVTEGQLLIDLDSTSPEADALRLRREMREQQFIAARLRALLEEDAELVPPGDLDATEANGAAVQQLLAINRQELRHRRADHQANMEALRQELQQREASKRSAEADISRLRQTVPLLEERSRLKADLAEQGYLSRSEYLQVHQDYIDRKQEWESAGHKRAEAQAAIDEVRQRLFQAEEQFRSDSLAQLAEAEQKSASLAQDLVKALDRRGHYQITAPVAGQVQQLAVHAPGAVVSPRQNLLMLVPDREGILVEAALPNKDAGFVLAGQAVEIKVEAFPFTRYGTIAGQVITVSADAMQGADNEPERPGMAAASGGQSAESQSAAYSVRIRLNSDHIAADGRSVALAPGMAVTAEIKTGRRRLISYLLDPLRRYGDESLRER